MTESAAGWVLNENYSIEQAPVEPGLHLYLLLQGLRSKESRHWSLLVGPPGGYGKLFQVSGDAESMQHHHIDNINIMKFASPLHLYTMARLTEEQSRRVEYHACDEAPPCSSDRGSAVEHCQGWCIRVLQKLADEGIVRKEQLASAKDMLEPI